MPMRCTNCKDFEVGMDHISGCEMLAFNHGYVYKGPTFKFCPFCGKELIEEKDPREDIVQQFVS
jgi:hypothetical protein